MVVSNAGPKKTVELVGKKNMDKGYLKELEETVRPAMVICIQWMTDRPVLEGNYLLVVGARRVNAIFQPTKVCPELALSISIFWSQVQPQSPPYRLSMRKRRSSSAWQT